MTGRVTWWTMTILAFGIAMYSIVAALTLAPDATGLIALKQLDAHFHYVSWVNWLYVHIATGVITLAIGPFLFMKRRPFHRQIGMTYVGAIVVSSIVSFVLAGQASGGPIAKAGFMALNGSWLVTTMFGFYSIKQGKVAIHQRWMMRSYALTFAGVTLRLWLPLMLIFIGEARFLDGYKIVAWLCWVPNLLVAEWLIRRKRL